MLVKRFSTKQHSLRLTLCTMLSTAACAFGLAPSHQMERRKQIRACSRSLTERCSTPRSAHEALTVPPTK